MVAVQVICYAAVVVFVVAVLVRVIRYAAISVGMRWELYPVPHEKGRAAWGGSIFEELEWWTKPRRVDMIGEIREMLSEIAVLKGVWHHNRKLWWFSFPFHFGLYLCIGWVVLLVLLGIFGAAGVNLGDDLATVATWLVAITGYAGFALVGLGALGLLLRRLFDPGMRRYSAPVDYFNLLLFIAAATVALAAQLLYDPGFSLMAGFVTSLVSFSTPADLHPLMVAEVVAGAVMVAYIPLGRMSHFVAKYFLYHKVRWEDEPNRPGSEIEKRVKQALGYRVDWAAPHIQQGKTWGEVTTELPAKQEVAK